MISCTKLKIYSAHVHVDSPGSETIFLSSEVTVENTDGKNT